MAEPAQLPLGKRLFFGGLIASLSVTAALAIGILLFSEFSDTSVRILTTTGLVALFSLVALPAGILLDQRRAVWLAWLVIALSAAAFAVSLVLIWRDWEAEGGEGLWKTLTVVAAFAVASSQIAMSTSRRGLGDTRVLRILYLGSIVLALAGASLIAFGAVAEVDSSGYWRVVGAVVIADLLFVIVQPIVRRLGSAPAAPELVFAFRCVLDGPAGETARPGTRPSGTASSSPARSAGPTSARLWRPRSARSSEAGGG